MRYFGLIAIFLLLNSCDLTMRYPSNHFALKFLKERGLTFEDFKFMNCLKYDTFDYNAITFKELKDTSLINKWFGTNYHKMFRIYFYSHNKPVGQILPLTFIQTGNDYGAIILKLIDMKTGEVNNTFELSGGACDGPEELANGKIELCSKNYSEFENDSIFKNTKVKFYSESQAENSEMSVDTLKYLITIKTNGNLNRKLTDSIRIETKTKNYVR